MWPLLTIAYLALTSIPFSPFMVLDRPATPSSNPAELVHNYVQSVVNATLPSENLATDEGTFFGYPVASPEAAQRHLEKDEPSTQTCLFVMTGDGGSPPSSAVGIGKVYLTLVDGVATAISIDLAHNVADPASAGIRDGNGAVLVDFGAPTSPIIYEFSQEDLEQTAHGDVTIFVASSTYPDGEITVVPQCSEVDPTSMTCLLHLSGKEVVPPTSIAETADGDFTYTSSGAGLQFVLHLDNSIPDATHLHFHHTQETTHPFLDLGTAGPNTCYC